MSKPKTVDGYIANAPEVVRERLKAIRKLIKEIAPTAEEKISYGMPYYGYKGRLVYFACFKNHIGVYIPTPTVEEHKNDLKDYETSTATIRFSNDKKLPLELIKKLVRARVKTNEKNTR